jgi:predicted dehydrogenase
LARQDIDAVMIGTPDHWHAIIAIEAAKAGKDIYCEKPMSLTIREARAMVNAVRRYGRVFQTGSQQRSSWQFRFACELVQSKRIGELKSIEVYVGGPSQDCYLPEEPVPKQIDWSMWLGPAPWRPYNSNICSLNDPASWRSYRDYSGGSMTDWGAHHFDIAQWGMGMDHSGPIEIIPPDGKQVKWLTYRYASGVMVTHGGPGGYGVIFNGTEGKIEVNRVYIRTWPDSIAQKPTGPNEVHLYRSPGHHNDWLRSIRTRQRPICDVEIGCRSVTVCHLGNLAYWLKRPLRWDPLKEEFVGDAEANRWLDRPKREPWTL